MQRLLLLAGVLAPLLLTANNILTQNTSLVLNTPGQGSSIIAFDLSWENSWRRTTTPINYDAAWVFVKYRVNGGDWQHAELSGTGNVPANATAELKDGKGAMIYRSANGTGPVNFSNVELIWNSAPADIAPSDKVDIKVFSIEMVYIPQAAYNLGNNAGNAGDASTWSFSEGATLNQSLRVASEASISVNDFAGSVFYSDKSGDRQGPIPAPFPKGFAAFYVMKYEMSQGQWVAFFNTLAANQKSIRDITVANGKGSDNVVLRNGVSYSPGSQATTSLPNVAMNYLSQRDAMAYLDWAALRPMTELEYEKASIGTIIRSPDLFPWGTLAIKTTGTYALTGAGTANERITAGTFSTTANGNHGGDVDLKNPDVQNINGGQGPFRVGVFAASTTSPNKARSGASFYGVLEMAGNLFEGAVGVGNAGGRTFTGLAGDGTLAADGNANTAGWPAVNNAVVNRGGAFDTDWTYGMVDDRTGSRVAETRAINTRYANFQMRGVRQ